MSGDEIRGHLDETLAALRDYSEALQQLPQGADFKYNNAFRGFPRAMRRHSEALQAIMTQVSRCNFAARRQTDFSKGSVGSKHTAAMDAIDSLHETVDHLLDEVKGEKLRAAEQLNVAFGSSAVPGTGGMVSTATNADFATKFSRHLRPQREFAVPVDNSDAPFRPLIYRADGTLDRGEAGVHPYQAALESLRFTEKQLDAGREVPYRPLDETPLVLVGTVQELDAMIDELAECEEVALDLEHHSYHSYLGFTCLAQLSSRTKDYVVDTLALRSHMHRLNRVLTDPAIVKVLHAAHEDVKWLQKDFGCYIVNMFDTALALQAMHMPHSLAFLVDHFCQVKLDKTYQTADWRVRPLPMPLVDYARQDTHYLLYCYDRLRALLHATSSATSRDTNAPQAMGNLLVHVLHESRRRCLTQFVKDPFDPERSWSVALGKSLGGLNKAQRDVAKLVFNWRDRVARAEDESPPAVLHTASVLTLATRLPVTARDVIRMAHPATVLLRRDAPELAKEIAAVVGETASAGPASPTTLDPSAAQKLGGADGEAADPRRALAHRPMTGTLPSCQPTSLATSPLFNCTAADARANGTSDALALLQLQRPGGAMRPSQELSRLAAAVPLPGVKRGSAAVAAAKSAKQADAAEAPKKAHRAEQPPAPKQAEAAEAATEDVVPSPAASASSPSKAPAKAQELPPSLKEEYGGLGRKTRRQGAHKRAK